MIAFYANPTKKIGSGYLSETLINLSQILDKITDLQDENFQEKTFSTVLVFYISILTNG